MKQFLLSFHFDFGSVFEPSFCSPQDQDFSQGQVFCLVFNLAELSIPIPSSVWLWFDSAEYWGDCSDSC